MRKFGYIATKRGMKIYGLIILSALISTALIAHGQEAAPPSVDLYSGQNQPEAASTPPSVPNGPELPMLSQLEQDSSKPKHRRKHADELRPPTVWGQLKDLPLQEPAASCA